MSRGDPIYKRCKCRDADGKKELGNDCPKLKRADGGWASKHGTWYFALELPPEQDAAAEDAARRVRHPRGS